MENESVRVREYRDGPGDRTQPHDHPDSVMVTLSTFRRRLDSDGQSREVAFEPGAVLWLPAQRHSGENIGLTETHVVFVELKGPSHERRADSPPPALGPTLG
jgi:quercetin dioxygenase-like cupin family protein